MFVIYGAYVLVGVATFVVARMLLQEQETRAAQEAIDDVPNRKASNFLVRMTRPFFTQYMVPVVRGKPFWDSKRKDYRRKLISSGLREELSPDEMIGFKLMLILFFPIAIGMLKAGGLIDVGLMVALVSAPLGWFYPDFWIKGRIKARHKQIRKSLPFVVDLLALSTEAGMDFVGAIGKVVEKSAPSPIVDELGQALREIKVGSSRSDALRELAARVDMTEVNSFIAVLISADQMGASIGKVLRQQSEQVRNARFLMAEKAGAIAAQKLILPTVLIVLPAIMLMIFGPVILGMISPGN